MNVLSLFDGMSCGQIALSRIGLAPENYFAAEIDKFAVKIAMKNFPDTKQIGDVTKVSGFDLPKIDLVIGGSPCQGFSNAGNGLNFDDPRSKLFFEFARILGEIRSVNPEVKFLLENVVMKKEWARIITDHLGVEPVEINSTLVSAQNRNRLYWTNIGKIEQPEDRGIFLRDVLDSKAGPELNHTETAINYMNRTVKGGRNHWDFAQHSDTDHEKSRALVAILYKGVPINVLIDRSNSKILVKDGSNSDFSEIDPGDCFDGLHPNSKTRRGRKMTEKSHTLTGRNEFYSTDENYRIRKFSPIECERLQTVPDNYTEGVSDSQRYKMLGNGWTVDVIAWILGHLPSDFGDR